MSFNILHCVPTAHAGKNGSAFSTDILCLTAQDFSKINNMSYELARSVVIRSGWATISFNIYVLQIHFISLLADLH
jgi:hypothetical protein